MLRLRVMRTHDIPLRDLPKPLPVALLLERVYAPCNTPIIMPPRSRDSPRLFRYTSVTRPLSVRYTALHILNVPQTAIKA